MLSYRIKISSFSLLKLHKKNNSLYQRVALCLIQYKILHFISITIFFFLIFWRKCVNLQPKITNSFNPSKAQLLQKSCHQPSISSRLHVQLRSTYLQNIYPSFFLVISMQSQWHDTLQPAIPIIIYRVLLKLLFFRETQNIKYAL